ncbi:hypothetical protein KR038_001857 [Drosophila bunnanda]|nr:hypothetical protein KR038_001857 [Drosophila bunnanda]
MCRFLILIILILGYGRTCSSWTPQEVVQRLNRDMELELNIYMDCGDIDILVDHAGVSNLQLNSLYEQRKLMGRFSERALIIACLRETKGNRTLRALKELLWGLQHLPILYILNSEMDFYFEKALQNGFLHTLALNSMNGSLYTYTPYPKIQIHQLEQIENFYKLTALKNLQGIAVNITGETMTPRCFHYNNRQGEKVYAGYMYKLVKGFIKAYNGTERMAYANEEVIPYEELKSELLSGHIDMMPRIIHILEWQYFYRSYILYNIKTFIIVPWAEPLPKSLYFLKPFVWTAWLTVMGSLIYSSIMIWRLKHRQKDASTLSSNFLDVLQWLFQLPVSHNWHYKLGLHRVIAFLVLFTVGFILTNLYLAQLSSFLTTGLFKKQLNTFQDLFRENRTLILESFDIEVLHNMTRDKLIQPEFENIVVSTSIAEVFSHRKSLNTTYVYTAYEDRIEFELYQQKYLRVPIFKRLNDIYDQRPVFVALRHGLPYVELFNDYLHRIWESGILAKFQSETLNEGISSGEISFRHSTSREIHVFDMEFYYFAYILLGVGWSISIIVFMVEKRDLLWRINVFNGVLQK